MPLNIEIPQLEHKYIRLYDTEAEYEADKDTYEEVCYSIIKSIEATEDNYSEYQYSTRTTNNDNEVKGKYWDMETPDIYAGLEIIWGYFGWEWVDFEWNGEILKGGNFYQVKPMEIVKSIPDGDRLQHINNWLQYTPNIKSIEEFDTSNIISAKYAFAKAISYNINFDITFPKLENASYMFHSAKVLNKTLDLPNLIDASYMFYNADSILFIKPIIASNKVKTVSNIYNGAQINFIQINNNTVTLEDLFWEGISESCNDYTSAFYRGFHDVTFNFHIKNITDDIIKFDNFLRGTYSSVGEESFNNIVLNLTAEKGVKGISLKFVNKNYGNLNNNPFNYKINLDNNIKKVISNLELSNFYYLNPPIDTFWNEFNFYKIYNNCKFRNFVVNYNPTGEDITELYNNQYLISFKPITINNIENEDKFNTINIGTLNSINFLFTFTSPIDYTIDLKDTKEYKAINIDTNINSFGELSYVKCNYLYLKTNIDYNLHPITFEITDKHISDNNTTSFILNIENSTIPPILISKKGLPVKVISSTITDFDGSNCTNRLDNNHIPYSFNDYNFSECPNLINISFGDCQGSYNFYNCKNIDKDKFMISINNQTWTKPDRNGYTLNITRELYNKFTEQDRNRLLELFNTINIQDIENVS